MKERPILFSAPMVRAILEGRKTQTRRIIKSQPFKGGGVWWLWKNLTRDFDGIKKELLKKCPYGHVGDRLWVRETFAHMAAEYEWIASTSIPARPAETWYAADERVAGAKWTPSIFMPRALSRITLEVVTVRVERLQDISEADCHKEGLEWCIGVSICGGGCGTCTEEGAKAWYRKLWESINRPDSWDANPWVWVIEFRRIEQ